MSQVPQSHQDKKELKTAAMKVLERAKEMEAVKLKNGYKYVKCQQRSYRLTK